MRRFWANTLMVSWLLVPADSLAARVITVEGPRVLLRDLIGARAVDNASTDLGPAPSPGARRRIFRSAAFAALNERAYGALPTYWDVETRGQQLSCAELTSRTQQALAARLPDGLSLQSLTCTRPITVPSGELQLDARVAEGSPTAGRVTLTIDIQVGTWPPRRVSLTGNLDGKRSVVVAGREIAPGVTVNAADLHLETRMASSLPSDCLSDAEGRRSLARVRAGALLRKGSLVEPPLVTSGAAVSIETQLQGLRVTARGTVRQDGRRGEMVTVLVTDSGKLVKARVAGPHLVLVDL